MPLEPKEKVMEKHFTLIDHITIHDKIIDIALYLYKFLILLCISFFFSF